MNRVIARLSNWQEINLLTGLVTDTNKDINRIRIGYK